MGFPTSTDVAHLDLVECSNNGICDRSNGVCECREGFKVEPACDVMACPALNNCNGHGTCYDMQQLAKLAENNGDLSPYSYGRLQNDPNTWDAEMLKGCVCDEGYEGYDCSLVKCPTGDDPDTLYIAGT